MSAFMDTELRGQREAEPDAITRPALRYYGGKFRLAPWLLSFFPPHVCYVEAFGGAASVLLQKERSYAEVYNDLDDDIWNFFRVVRDPVRRAALEQACRLTPYSRREFELAYEATDCPVERARRTAIRAGMGFGSAGVSKGTTGFRIDTRRKNGTAQQLWVGFPDGLAALGERMAGVLLENRDGIGVMRQHDAPTTLHFVDPPYLPETRVLRRGQAYYRHEMTPEQHADLLDAVDGLTGMVVLCGYPSALYEACLPHWRRHTTRARISGNRGTAVRTEVVWLNPACVAALEQSPGGLFEGVGAPMGNRMPSIDAAPTMAGAQSQALAA